MAIPSTWHKTNSIPSCNIWFRSFLFFFFFSYPNSHLNKHANTQMQKWMLDIVRHARVTRPQIYSYNISFMVFIADVDIRHKWKTDFKFLFCFFFFSFSLHLFVPFAYLWPIILLQILIGKLYFISDHSLSLSLISEWMIIFFLLSCSVLESNGINIKRIAGIFFLWFSEFCI